ncbi:hypothetical protein [Halobacillus campisalis]|uniref:CopG family transcriptional regulator n=1 Tax=Halobacillus campisalis TaxID=435909 RepID=A0ABW2KA33_9BACI|nr:hypothetical protein [Halobacillus campisalis]
MPVRVNSRISDSSNEWLDKKSEEMALTKSALINLAIENYIKEKEVVQNLPKIVSELERQGVNLNDRG